MIEVKMADGTLVVFKCVVQLMPDHPALQGVREDTKGAGAFGRMGGIKAMAMAFGRGVGLSPDEVMLVWTSEHVDIVEDTDGAVFVGSQKYSLDDLKTAITGLSPEEANLALSAYDRLMGGARP